MRKLFNRFNFDLNYEASFATIHGCLCILFGLLEINKMTERKNCKNYGESKGDENHSLADFLLQRVLCDKCQLHQIRGFHVSHVSIFMRYVSFFNRVRLTLSWGETAFSIYFRDYFSSGQILQFFFLQYLHKIKKVRYCMELLDVIVMQLSMHNTTIFIYMKVPNVLFSCFWEMSTPYFDLFLEYFVHLENAL